MFTSPVKGAAASTNRRNANTKASLATPVPGGNLFSDANYADANDDSTGASLSPSLRKSIDIPSIVSDSSFLEFLQTKARLLEKALTHSDSALGLNIFHDYRIDSSSAERRRNRQNKCLLPCSHFDQINIRGRPIMDIQYSPRYPELFLVAYGSKSAQSTPANLSLR